MLYLKVKLAIKLNHARNSTMFSIYKIHIYMCISNICGIYLCTGAGAATAEFAEAASEVHCHSSLFFLGWSFWILWFGGVAAEHRCGGGRQACPHGGDIGDPVQWEQEDPRDQPHETRQPAQSRTSPGDHSSSTGSSSLKLYRGLRVVKATPTLPTNTGPE